MNQPNKTYDELITTLREISLLGTVGSLLGWDEQCYMPEGGTSHRASQSSMLARMTHQQFTSPRIGEMLKELESSELVRDPESDAAVNVRETRRSYNRATKLPTSLVEELAKTSVMAHHAWIDARKKSEFKAFAPYLQKMVDLKRQVVNCYGYKNHPYDALLDDYEPSELTENIQKVFVSLRDPLIELVGKITSSGRVAPIEILERKYPRDIQEKLAKEAAAAVGFDFKTGRLDTAVHPFCTTIGPDDTRMTTRYDENFFPDCFFSVLHETGHGLYGQGCPKEHFGTPRGNAISLGIHESQSRMWENFVGRSRAFWKYFLPKVRAAFGDTLKDVNEEQWLWAINDIRPSFIRVEADEATYNLHILLRFEMEQGLITGDMPIDQVPSEWNARMKKYLGITPPDDARGCLQDVHWSGGGIGYFPTYTLGNLYAAQFFEQARKDVGDLDKQFASGEFMPLLKWLREKIHSQGKKYTASQLVKRVTGEALTAEPLLRHLRKKASELYKV